MAIDSDSESEAPQLFKRVPGVPFTLGTVVCWFRAQAPLVRCVPWFDMGRREAASRTGLKRQADVRCGRRGKEEETAVGPRLERAEIGLLGARHGGMPVRGGGRRQSGLVSNVRLTSG